MAEKRVSVNYGSIQQRAENIIFDDTSAQLGVDNVQDAIDSNLVVEDITSSLVFESVVPAQSAAQIDTTKLTKVGKVVTACIRFTTPSSVVSGIKIASINPKYAPLNRAFNVLISNSPSWSGKTGVGCLRAETNGDIVLPYTTWEANTDVSCVMTWITN